MQVCPNENPKKPPSFVCVGCEVPLESRLCKNRRGRGDRVLESRGFSVCEWSAENTLTTHRKRRGRAGGVSRARLVYSSRGKPRSPLRWSRGTRDEDRQMCRIVRGFCNVCLLDTSRVKTRQNVKVKRSSGSLRDPDPRGAPQAPPRTKIQKLDESSRAKSKNEKRVRNQNPNPKICPTARAPHTTTSYSAGASRWFGSERGGETPSFARWRLAALA